ncbi:MAG: UvrD-helicase domain-containing protein [Xenococcus sp. (in: cyanobacteria)]
MNNWVENYRDILPWSDYQTQVFDNLETGKHLLIHARAGSGKTTLLEGIVASLLNQNPNYNILLLAFNKHIATELKTRERIPRQCEVRTSHSMGYKLLRKHLPILRETDSLKIPKLANKAIEKISVAESDLPKINFQGGFEAKQRRSEFLRNLRKLVDMARNNFANSDDELDTIREKFGFNKITQLERYWLYRCLWWILKKDEQLAKRGEIDYGDMLYLPHIWNIKPPSYNFVLVDEVQDVNLCQIRLYQSMVNRGATFICVGDKHQSVYGFTGSGIDSWTTLQFLIKCQKFQLPICYRCGKKILKEAQKLVDIKPAPFAIQGEVKEIKSQQINKLVKPGHLILSRLNAPLISRCLSLIIQGKRAKVRGKNVAKYLLEFIERFMQSPTDFPMVWHIRMTDYCQGRIQFLKENGAELEARDFQDVYESLDFLYRAFVLEDCIYDLDRFKAKILDLFDDNDKNCVILSTIHRAKGDEANTVYILDSGKLPYTGKNANDAQKEQETNLVYVAITRAKKMLYFVDGKPDI